MAGILYGVGVGPGDPELMTLKAVRLIRESEVIAVPGSVPQESAAYKIAVQAVPELADKTLIAVETPMVHDREKMRLAHEKSVKELEVYLNQDKNVAFLTLGDPTIYSTFLYFQRIAEEGGFETALVSGIPSFCAAAARLNQSLSLWNEPLHILPAVHRLDRDLPEEGTCVLMKSGRGLEEVRRRLREEGWTASMVENCGMENERLYPTLEDMPDRAGYYTLIIARKDRS